MKKPRVLLDCDGVLADFCGPALAVLRRLSGRALPYEDLTSFRLVDAAGEEHEGAFLREVSKPGFVSALAVLPGAKAGVEALRAVADVKVVTAHLATSPTWVYERQAWLERHFGFGRRDVVHTPAKELVAGDVLVDDKAEHLRRWAEAHPRGLRVLWAAPYNRAEDCARPARLYRTSSWAAVVDAALLAVP